MKFERTVVPNSFIYNAIIGIRHSYDSEAKSDSFLYDDGKLCIGEKDKDLIARLIKSGPSHRKFLRQIPVSVDITGPLYWWKEMDQYRINCTTNSASTMHKIMAYEFTEDMFDMDGADAWGEDALDEQIVTLNKFRNAYLEESNAETKKKLWKDLICLLPESFNQKRLWTSNYEVVKSACEQRKGHKLSQWHDFIDWAKILPFAKEFELVEE